MYVGEVTVHTRSSKNVNLVLLSFLHFSNENEYMNFTENQPHSKTSIVPYVFPINI